MINQQLPTAKQSVEMTTIAAGQTEPDANDMSARLRAKAGGLMRVDVGGADQIVEMLRSGAWTGWVAFSTRYMSPT